MESLELEEHADKHAKKLSGGTKRKVTNHDSFDISIEECMQ